MVGQNHVGASASPVGAGQPMGSPLPPVGSSASPAGSNNTQSWQQGYPMAMPPQNASEPSFYPNYSPGGMPGEQGEPKKKWYRNKKIIFSIVIGVVLTIALVSGIAYAVSGKSKPKSTVASSPASKTTTATETPTPEITRVELPAEFKAGDVTAYSDWEWQGGAMVTKIDSQGENANPNYYFQVWAPQLKDQVANCVLSPAQNGEKMAANEISVTATYGDKPTVFVVYTILTKAVGTSPETVHLYAQELELPSCTAKPRIDLQTEADNVVNDRQEYKYEVIGNSESKIAVAKTWITETHSPWSRQRHVQVMAITAGEKNASSLQEAQGEENEVGVSYSVTNDAYMITTDKRRVYSIDNNKVLFDLPLELGDDDTKCESFMGVGGDLVLFRLSADKYVYEFGGHINDGHDPDKSYLVTASSGEAVPLPKLLKLSKDNPYGNAYYRQFKDGSLLVTISDSHQAFHIGTDGTASAILDSAQWERLLHSTGSHFGVANYLNNQFYVQTTDEILTMDLTGKSVKTLEEEPQIVSLAIDTTKVNWIAWKATQKSPHVGAILTTGALPDESENTDDESEETE